MIEASKFYTTAVNAFTDEVSQNSIDVIRINGFYSEIHDCAFAVCLPVQIDLLFTHVCSYFDKNLKLVIPYLISAVSTITLDESRTFV